jgi:hypothetical protein
MTFGDEIYADAGPGAVEQPAELPPPVRETYRTESLGGDQGLRWWPISGQVESGVVYHFDVPHCGLDWVVDFDGNFWEPDYPPGREPSYASNGDRGTMTLIEPDRARYVASDDSQITLVRVDGPIVRQLCR